MSKGTQALRRNPLHVRFSFKHHMLPPILGLVVSLMIYALLNASWVVAQARYHLPQLLHVNTNASAAAAAVPASASELRIPKINVSAPINFESSTNNTDIAYSLRSGVVHYASTAVPGQQGDVVIFGHSSGLVWAPGSYKFVFTLLNELKPGDTILVDYKGTRYIYQVTGSQTVKPADMSILQQNSKQSELSLVTCTPVGTDKNRLVVHARQLRPSPANNQPAPSTAASGSTLPGN